MRSSNIFNTGRRPQRPPPYCKSLDEDLPPLPYDQGLAQLQGYASWLDPDPLAYNDVAMYTVLPRLGGSWQWVGEEHFDTFILRITMRRLAPGGLWRITIACTGDPTYEGSVTLDDFPMDITIPWDTGHLTKSAYPGEDKVTARVTA